MHIHQLKNDAKDLESKGWETERKRWWEQEGEPPRMTHAQMVNQDIRLKK